MTDPEGTPQDAELDSESATDEAPADVNEESDVGEEPWEEAMTADYQERLREFDNVESTPVASLPGQSSQLSESDLEVQPPGEQSG